MQRNAETVANGARDIWAEESPAAPALRVAQGAAPGPGARHALGCLHHFHGHALHGLRHGHWFLHRHGPQVGVDAPGLVTGCSQS